MRKKERFVLGKRTFRSQKSKHFVLRIIKADADKEVNVGNEKIILSETTISPTVFTDQVELFGNEKVDLLEVITLDGKTVIRQKNPGKIVYTGSLSSGIYIFRIHTDGKAKTMKAQKIN